MAHRMNDKLHAAEWRVLPTNIEKSVNLVRDFHYIGNANHGVIYCFGLFRKDEYLPVGVSMWQLAGKGSVDKFNPDGNSTTLTLTRLVIMPDIPNNAASFLLGRSIRFIKKDNKFNFLITYADTYQNHTGAIYKATNWQYMGMTNPEPVWIMPDGTLKSRYKSGKGSNTHNEMLAQGAKLVRKHIFIMQWKFSQHKNMPRQMEMFE